MTADLNDIKISLRQTVRILELLERKEPLSKEDIYKEISGSRQTRIRIVKEMLDLNLIRIVSVEAHNKQNIERTEQGVEFLERTKPCIGADRRTAADPSQDVRSQPADGIRAQPVMIRDSDSAPLRQFKENINTMVQLINSEPINFDFLKMAMSATMDKLDRCIEEKEAGDTRLP
ncbi:MAG: hypothetical protein IKR86_04690 [Candidatus Methanomethylophilaceae archaeon]|nr:hypothetical protein [Candidatus Methanomethylophilaceae archaeon]